MSTSLASILVLFLSISAAAAFTYDREVQALQELYETFNNSSLLKSWKSNGGDPCGESWTGVYCKDSSVIRIILPGLALTGYLGDQLSSFENLRQLDLSYNEIYGEIPTSLPRSMTHLNLASNQFYKGIPYTLKYVKYLRHMNLSHNYLSGPIGNVFTRLTNLQVMDLSNNRLSGSLPSSFANLTNLKILYLQNNQIFGTVSLLAALPLSDLDIENNLFSGFLPNQFKSIKKLSIGSNNFEFQRQYITFDTSMALLSTAVICIFITGCNYCCGQNIDQEDDPQQLDPQLENINTLILKVLESRSKLFSL